MITDILSSIIIAFAFFSVIPMPKLEWTGKRMSYVPFAMPFVGLINGLISFGLYSLLNFAPVTPFLKAVLMTLYFIAFTGGLHIDGLMDTADAYFSRRDRERKLEIMKDSNVGAFAVVTLIFTLLFKTALFYELFSRDRNIGLLLVFIPVISRLLQSSMLFAFHSAKADGLTKMFGKLKAKNSIFLFILLALVSVILFFVAGIYALLIPLSALVYYFVFYISSKRQFGGITGDLLGAFLEVSELIMLFSLLFVQGVSL